MRAGLIAVAAVAASWAGSGEAAGPIRSARSVELISMGGSSAPREATSVEDSAPPVSGTPDRAIPLDFRVHDLSRRWVEFQMADSFRALPENGGESGDAPLSAAPIDGTVPAMTAIPVPLWMHGGAMVSAAAPRFVPGCAAVPYRPTGFLEPDAEDRRAGYYALMSNIACEHGIPVGLFDAMIIRESRYRANVFSPKNAFGLTQLMPGTAAGLGVNRYQVEENLWGGAKYLRQQLDHFGQYHLALAAYNAGPGRVRNGLVPQISQTRDYVDNVLFNWSRLSGFQRRAIVLPQVATAPRGPARPTGRMATVSAF